MLRRIIGLLDYRPNSACSGLPVASFASGRDNHCLEQTANRRCSVPLISRKASAFFSQSDRHKSGLVSEGLHLNRVKPLGYQNTWEVITMLKMDSMFGKIERHATCPTRIRERAIGQRGLTNTQIRVIPAKGGKSKLIQSNFKDLRNYAMALTRVAKQV
jgi:hypothetical protein